MKRWIIALTILFASLVAVPVGSAAAVDVLQPVCGANSNPTVCKDNQAGSSNNPIFGPSGVATRAMQILAIIVGISAVIAITISGAMLVFSGGDSGKAETARRALSYSVVGLVVAVLAQSIVLFVLSKL